MKKSLRHFHYLALIALASLVFTPALLAKPETLVETLAAMQTSQEKLTDAVDAKDAKTAHHIAEDLSGASLSLLGKLDGLDEEQIKAITTKIRTLSRTYDKIHLTVEVAAFIDATKENARARTTLKSLQAQLAR